MATDTPTATDTRWHMGDRLRKARSTAGLSTDEMAELLGYDPKTIRNYEGAVTIPHRGTIVAWAQYTQHPADWLMYGSSPDTDHPMGWRPGDDISPNGDCPCNSPWNPAQIALPLAAA